MSRGSGDGSEPVVGGLRTAQLNATRPGNRFSVFRVYTGEGGGEVAQRSVLQRFDRAFGAVGHCRDRFE